MPNLYVTEDEIKQVAPDAILITTTQYDKLFITLAERISRWVDNHTQRMFFPFIDTRFYSVSRNRGHHGTFGHHGFSDDARAEFEDLWIDDLIEITSVNVSDDDGANYTELAATDYIAMHGQDFNSEKSFTLLKIDQNGTIGSWPVGQRSVKIVGTWNFTDDRSSFFEDTLDAVVDAPLSDSATEVTLTDVDGLDLHGLTPRVSPGNLLRIESEILEVTATDTATQKATITRGVNGSVAAAHVATTQIDKFVAPQPLKQACIIQAVRQYKRGQGGFGDAVANLDMGRILIMKTLDPEALVLLQAYTKLEFG